MFGLLIYLLLSWSSSAFLFALWKLAAYLIDLADMQRIQLAQREDERLQRDAACVRHVDGYYR